MKVFVITGTSSGIGASVLKILSLQSSITIFSIARRTLEDIPTAFSPEKLDAITTAYRNTHSCTTIFHLQADLSLPETPQLFSQFVQAHTNHIDGLLLNAGSVDPLGPLSTLHFPSFQK